MNLPEDSQSARSKFRPDFWVLFFTLVGFGLRLQKLDLQPLWGDEGWSFYFATQSLPRLLALTAIDIHPPLYYMLLKGWLLITGVGPEEARFFSVLAGTALIPVIGGIGRRLFDGRVGSIAAATTTVMPLAIYYSQEVRMYGLVTLLGALSTYFLLKSHHQAEGSASINKHGAGRKESVMQGLTPSRPLGPRRFFPKGSLWQIGYVVTTTAALYTMYYAVFITLFQGLYILISHPQQRRSLISRLRPVAYCGLLYLPWVLYAGPRLTTYIDNKRNVEGYLPLNFIRFFGDHLVAFSLGHLPDGLHSYLWGAVAMVLVAALGLVSPLYLKSKRALLLYLYLFLPLLAGYLINQIYPFTPPYFERTLLLAAPAYWLFIAAGVIWLWDRQYLLVGTVVTAMLMAVSVSLFGYYNLTRYPDQDYRPLLQAIAARSTPDDTVLASYQWQLGFYQAYLSPPRPNLFTVPDWGRGWSSETADPDRLTIDLTAIFNRSPRLWFPAYQSGGHIWEDEAEEAIANLGYPALLQWYSPETKLTLAGPPQEPLHHVTAANFEHRITLLEATIGGTAYQAGRDIVPVQLTWRKENNLGSEHWVSLRLIDATGRSWASRDSHPRAGLTHFTDMSLGDTLLDQHGLLAPAGAPPGQYRLMLAIRRTRDAHPLNVVDEAGQSLGPELLLAEIALVPPSPAIGKTALPIQVEVESVFGGQVRLVGYSLGQAPFKAGETLPLTLFWESLVDGPASLAVLAELQDASGQTIASHQQQPIWPATEWRQGTLLQDPHDFPLPPTLVPDQYQLVVGVMTSTQERLNTDGQAYLPLTSVTTVDRPHIFEMPKPEIALAVDFGEQARLIGLDLPRTKVKAGEAVKLALYWQAIKSFDKSWTVFVHLTDGAGQIINQRDQIPGQGRFPTTGWLPDEYVVDRYTLLIPPNTLSGQRQYYLKIGLYDANNFNRLPVVKDGEIISDHVTLESWPIFVE